MKKLLPFLLFAAFTLVNCTKGNESMQPESLSCEQMTNPVGIETSEPRFSWILQNPDKGISQSAYQILVATSPSLLNEEDANVWNSGKVDSDQSILVAYSGPAPVSGQRYFWKVRIWDQDNIESVYSKPAYWEMGLTDPNDWKAEWIGFTPGKIYENAIPDDLKTPRSILLRKEFQINSNIESAKVYVTGLGNYILYLNGKKVGKDLLTPGWTDYRKRVNYQIYDVTELLQKGENAAGIMLGNMWWSSGLGWNGAAVYSNGPLRAIMQLEIEYKNGEKELIVTDETWKGNISPITENTIYHGETYDARLEIPMWNEPGLESSKWSDVEKIEMDSIILSTSYAPPIRISDEIVPVSVNEVKSGVFVYDMGFNMVGSVRLKVSGNNGDTIILRFAELLHEDGTVAQENLRSAKVTDYYILKGTEEEIWEPQFTYHGYQYVQVEGLQKIDGTSNITGLRFYSSAPETGKFSSSNDMLNKVWANILNGQKGNMMDVPTDCPQRDERLGWMGDAQIFAPTSCYNMNMAGFYNKWMRDITDSQDEDSGYVYDVNPAIVVGGPSKAGWGDAVTVIPWVVYNFYGDTKIIEDNYEGMKAWVEYMRRKSVDNIYQWSENKDDWEGYGDWISVEKSPTRPISAAYYYYSTHLLSEMAGIIGKNTDQVHYANLAEDIKNAFHQRFYESNKMNYPGATQTANLIPVSFNLTPDSLKTRIAANIADNVIAKGKHPTTGFLGTNLLLPRLSDYGYHQLAYETAINEEYPSWVYMVKNGASSIWELWNSDKEKPEGMNSRNHFALGSVGEWFYGYLAGIRPLEPGFKKSLIAPMPAEGLNAVSGEIVTPYGKLKSEWTSENGQFNITVSIPANTTAVFVIPDWKEGMTVIDENNSEVLSDSGLVAENQHISSVDFEGKPGLLLKSGTYTFTIK